MNEMTPQENKVFSILSSEEWTSTSEVSYKSGLVWYATQDVLQYLLDKNLIEVKNNNSRNWWRKVTKKSSSSPKLEDN